LNHDLLYIAVFPPVSPIFGSRVFSFALDMADHASIEGVLAKSRDLM